MRNRKQFSTYVLTATVLGLIPGPVLSQARDHYVVTLVAARPAPKKPPIIAHVVWRGDATRWSAGRSEVRADIVCAHVARALGRVAAFVAGGETFNAGQLERCNQNAR